MSDHLKCKLCNFTVKKFWKNKKGELRSGQKLLKAHFEIEHMDEYLAIQDRLDDDMQLEILEAHENG